MMICRIEGEQQFLEDYMGNNYMTSKGDTMEQREQSLPAVAEGRIPEVGITLHCNILTVGVGKAMKTCSASSINAVLCAQKGKSEVRNYSCYLMLEKCSNIFP